MVTPSVPDISNIHPVVEVDLVTQARKVKYSLWIKNAKIVVGYTFILFGIASALSGPLNYPALNINGWPINLLSFYSFISGLALFIGISVLKEYYSLPSIIFGTFKIVVYLWILLIWIIYGWNGLLRVWDIIKDLLALWPF